MNTLRQNGLIDSFRLMLFPLVLPGGKRLFKDEGKESALSLTDTQTTSTGVVVHIYER